MTTIARPFGPSASSASFATARSASEKRPCASSAAASALRTAAAGRPIPRPIRTRDRSMLFLPRRYISGGSRSFTGARSRSSAERSMYGIACTSGQQ